MLDEPPDEIKDGDGFCNQFIILMAVIVTGDHVTLIFINAGGGDNRPSKVSADVFGNDFGTPSSTVPDTALGEKTVDMWLPFEVTFKGMEDTDKTGSEAFGSVIFMEHTKDDTVDGREETAQQGAVSEED